MKKTKRVPVIATSVKHGSKLRFASITEASQTLGVNKATISRMVNNRPTTFGLVKAVRYSRKKTVAMKVKAYHQKTAGGFTWRKA